MIIVMKPDAKKEQVEKLQEELIHEGMTVQLNEGVQCTVLGIIGDTQKLDYEALGMRDGVERVMRVQEPFKKSNRKFHNDDTMIHVGGVQIGGGTMTVMAGVLSHGKKPITARNPTDI